MSRRLPRHKPSSSPSQPSASPSPLPLGDLIENIPLNSLKAPRDVSRAEITDTELVSSYNWIEGDSPKILIPGKPPLWTPSTGSTRLPEDDGVFYRDINAASYPLHPLEPAIISIMKMNPDPMPVNIVACGSTIGNLLRYSGASPLDKPFRVLVEAVGDTVHFVRREDSARAVIPGIKGFGHTFPKAFTTWSEETKRSYSHQRVVRYLFGGLRMMVRCEADGYIEGPTSWRRQKPKPMVSLDGNDLGDLAAMSLGDASIGSRDSNAELEVIDGGSSVPLESTFDLKTRWGGDHQRPSPRHVLQKQIHRLWVSQIKQFIVAFHNNGAFSFRNINIMKVEEDVRKWENDKQQELLRLAALLHLIVDRAHEASDGKIEIVCSPGEPLQIRKQISGSGELLSTSVRRDWAAWLGEKPTGDEKQEEVETKQLSPGNGVVGYGRGRSIDDFEGNEEAPDYTACDAECGYCGKCSS